MIWPDDAPLPGATWHGFTVRSLHGAKNWVAGPGSVKPDGRAYRDLYPGRPIATMPVDLACSGQPARLNRQTEELPERLTTHDEIVSFAGRLRFAGATADDIERTLLACLADGRIYASDPAWPWTDRDLAVIASGIGGKPRNGPTPITITGTAPARPLSADATEPSPNAAIPTAWPVPEDRGTAVMSELGGVEYVEDLIRPARIVAWAAEEGSGKSFSVDDELAIRIAVAGGSFAGTWPILQNGPVLYLSEMHADDDFEREETVLASLGRTRADLTGCYYRLSLMTAAGGKPALTVPEWRDWVTEWMREHGVLMVVFDTATGATQVDPWGKAIQEVFANLRVMLDSYPALAVVLLLHLKKPNGRGERRISDVLGEWGRWCDVVVLMENDAASLTRAKLTVRKRVRRERRVGVSKAGGLLIDPVDLDETKGTKVPISDVLAAIAASPGIGYAELGKQLGVSKDTASNYVAALGDQVDVAKTGPRKAAMVFVTAEPPNTAERASFGSGSTDVTSE